MTLTNEEEKLIKEELLKQLDKVPPESKDDIEKQIKSMSKDQLEEFIKKNQKQSPAQDECIFCSIVKGKTPSIKLEENENSVAVLDINPVSVGHTLIIPKDHKSEPNEKTQELAFSIGKKILENLKPKDITTRAAKIMDHTILNVIPLYENTNLEKRIQTTEEELVKTAEKILGEKLLSEKTEKTKEEEKPKEPICILCAITKNEMPSYKIDENKENLAILEINPTSIGHTLIIPKVHNDTTQLPSSSFTLAKKIAKKIKTKYKPNDIKINPTSISNHALIELIPIYNDTNLTKKIKVEKEELKNIQKKLSKRASISQTTTKKSPKVSQKTKTLTKKRKYPLLPELPPRIP